MPFMTPAAGRHQGAMLRYPTRTPKPQRTAIRTSSRTCAARAVLKADCRESRDRAARRTMSSASHIETGSCRASTTWAGIGKTHTNIINKTMGQRSSRTEVAAGLGRLSRCRASSLIRVTHGVISARSAMVARAKLPSRMHSFMSHQPGCCCVFCCTLPMIAPSLRTSFSQASSRQWSLLETVLKELRVPQARTNGGSLQLADEEHMELQQEAMKKQEQQKA